MKRYLLIAYWVLWHLIGSSYAQVVHQTGSVDQYEGDSYEVLYDLQLIDNSAENRNFSFKASTGDSFKASIKEIDYAPGQGEIVQSYATPIVITFNDLMDIADVESEVTITGSISGEITGSWLQDSRTYTFEPIYVANETITVSISDQLSGSYNRWIPQNISWSFSIDAFTYVPDDNLEQTIINIGADNVMNDFVRTDYLKNVYSLTLSSIGEFTGIEDAEFLSNLTVYNTSATTIDLSSNKHLTEIDIYGSSLSNIIGLEQNHLLEKLRVRGSDDLTINMPPSINLEYLEVEGLSIDSVDLSIYDRLTNISIRSSSVNPVTSIDFPINLQISSDVFLSNSNISEIDLSVSDKYRNVDVRNNPYLSCVQVHPSDVFSAQRDWLADSNTSFVIDCNRKTYIPDDNFELALEDLGIVPATGQPDDYVLTELIEVIKTLNIKNKNVTDLTGLEDFIGLENLYADNNNINSIDLTGLSELIVVDLDYNMLSEFTLYSSSIAKLYLSNNQLTSLDLDAPNLTELHMNQNRLGSLDLDSETSLVRLWCRSNQLSSLDLSSTEVDYLYSNHNPDLNCVKVAESSFFLSIGMTCHPALNAFGCWSADTWTTASVDCNVSGLRIDSRTDETSQKTDPRIELYPNPAKHYFELDMKDQATGSLEIYDLAGRELRSSESLTKGKNRFTTENLPNGVVILKVTSDNNLETIRLNIK